MTTENYINSMEIFLKFSYLIYLLVIITLPRSNPLEHYSQLITILTFDNDLDDKDDTVAEDWVCAV